MDVNVYVIILLFVSIMAGILSGIYAGMAIAVKILGEKDKKVSFTLRKKLPRHSLKTKRIRGSGKDNPPAIEAPFPEQEPISEYSKPGTDEEQELSVQNENKQNAEDTLNYPEKAAEETEEEISEDEEDKEDTKQSYLEFVCESVGQDAVSRMRAVRKTQDNKYMNRINKKKTKE